MGAPLERVGSSFNLGPTDPFCNIRLGSVAIFVHPSYSAARYLPRVSPPMPSPNRQLDVRPNCQVASAGKHVYLALVDSMGDSVFRSDVRRALDTAERAARGDSLHARGKAEVVGLSIGTLISDPTMRANLVQGLITTVPRMMFVLMPLFAVALKLFYIRRKRLYVEHLVFALHVHAFLFLYIAVAALFPILYAGVGVVALLYTFLALKKAYGQGWFKTLIKTFLSCGVYSTMLIMVVSAGITVYGLFVAAQAERMSVWQLITG